MKKEELSKDIKSNDERKVSHINVLWLIYRALAENIDISMVKNKSADEIDTEEDR